MVRSFENCSWVLEVLMKMGSFGSQGMIVGCIFLLVNCSGRNADLKPILNSQTPVSKSASPAPAVPASTSKCENGQTPKVISGECSGVWSVKKTADATTCEFDWKPRVTCPTGMKPLGLQAACYGVTIRPADANTKTAEDCQTAHGKHPISPVYKLECCF